MKTLEDILVSRNELERLQLRYIYGGRLEKMRSGARKKRYGAWAYKTA